MSSNTFSSSPSKPNTQDTIYTTGSKQLRVSLYAGLLTGCGQKSEIVRHYEGQLCSKKIPIVQQIVRQSIPFFKNVLGVLNSVLIGILVYLSDGINTISWNHVVLFCCQIGKRQCHIYLPEKSTLPLTPPPLLRTELLGCIFSRSKILHTNPFIRVYKCAHFFRNFTWKVSMHTVYKY